MRIRLRSILLAVLLVNAPAWGAGLEEPLKAVRAVGPESQGQQEAAAAWKVLAAAPPASIPAILTAFDNASPLATNWLATAVDAISERALATGESLPADELDRFVLDRAHSPRARRLAYEWLVRVRPEAADRLLPQMLEDRSLELRRDAVARRIAEAIRLSDAGRKADAIAAFRVSLAAARDQDQIRDLSSRLRAVNEPVDLPRVFGFLLAWKVAGPFDNTAGKGFVAAYPPEEKVDLQATYPGKHGSVGWVDGSTKDDYGVVDLNKPLGEEKDVVGYATTEFRAENRRDVQFRLASFNAVKVWLNGRLIDVHEVYHSGSQMDQYISRATLESGSNRILVKVCQNAQTQPWAKAWGFQLRVCDLTGGAVLSADRE